MKRLSDATLAALPADIDRPRYDRRLVESGVVHLGVGAFHRAHQAIFFEHALAGGDLRWGITGASLRSPSVRDSLKPQDGLYSVVVRDGVGDRVQVIGALRQTLVAPECPETLVAALARPTTHIVTLTITEKGYGTRPAGLDQAASDQSAPEFLVSALARRHDAGIAPFTTISCDNLPENGRRLEAAVLAIAQRRDPALADWIATHAAFPSTMVDRIVPATVQADIDALAGRIGLEDHGMVKTEPFRQWVIEDRFCGPRPDFEAAGVQLTDSVAPWEDAKLRLLNGAHSALAYLGCMAGIAYVHDAIALPQLRVLIDVLMTESATTLMPPAGLDLHAYRGALMKRFANPALLHRLDQIAIDGSQKLPQRLLAPIVARLDQGRDAPALTLAVAAWMRWLGGRNDLGEHHIVNDPLAERIADRLHGLVEPAEQVAALLTIEAIFPARLATDSGFRESLTRDLRLLQSKGALGLMSEYCATRS